MVDPQPRQEPVDPPGLELGEIGDRRAEMRRADRRQAQHPARPVRVRQEQPRVEAPHAVADQVDGLVGEGGVDLLAQPRRPGRDPRDRRNLGHQDPVPGRAEPSGMPRK